jgi:hypothetical protein
MERGEALVERRHSPGVMPGELRQVGIGQLVVADHTGDWDLDVMNVIWPEPMAAVLGQDLQDTERGLSRLSFAHQEPQSASLCDRACGKLLKEIPEPTLGRIVVNMFSDQQGNKDVGIQQHDHLFVLERADILCGDDPPEANQGKPSASADRDIGLVTLPEPTPYQVCNRRAQGPRRVPGDGQSLPVQVVGEVNRRSHDCIILRLAS